MNEITTAKVSLSILPSKDSRPPMKQLLKKILQKCLLKKGMQITSVGEDYFSPGDVVPKAKEANLSLATYLENNNIGGVGKRYYTFPLVTSISLINEFKQRYNLELIATFNVPYHASMSTYFLFLKPYD